MLDRLRQGARGWVSKILMGLLVLSFAVWGIGGFEGYGAGTLASVGDEEVSVPEFARMYEQYQRSAQAAGRDIQPAQVLDRLLLNAALDDQARSYNLGVSDARVAREIAEDVTFQGPGGAFDRNRFELILRNAGLDRDDYVADIRQAIVRQQIAGAVGAGLDVPQPMLEALYRFRNEERVVSSVLVDESMIEAVGEPGEGALQAYFEDNRERFTAPEYRTLGLVVLDPVALADPAAVADEDVAALYEQRKASLTRPERRRVEQIAFPTAEAAQAAFEKAEAGTDFAALAGEGAAPTDLGLKTQAEFLDPAIAAAAFAAEPDTIVPAIEGALQPSLIRVTAIEAGSVTPLEDVAEKLRSDIARRAAGERINDVYDQIEDERAGGALLEEAAAKLSIPYRTIARVSPEGTGEDGAPVADLPGGPQLLAEAFDSDVGLENNALRLGDGSYVFYEVLDIVPSRQRTLDEVRDEILAAWKADETAARVEEKAGALFERLRQGETLAAIAAELGATVQTIEGVKRGLGAPGLSANAAAQGFGGPEGHVANAEADSPPDRILLRVDRVISPPFFAEAADTEAIAAQLEEALRNDVLVSFNRQLLQARDTRVNNAAFSQLTGTLQAQ